LIFQGKLLANDVVFLYISGHPCSTVLFYAAFNGFPDNIWKTNHLNQFQDMDNRPLSVIVLAAGKGTRMKSEKAKVLHEALFVPMIHHVLTAALVLEPARTVVIVGHQQNRVKEALAGFDVDFAVQREQLGTGHAVLVSAGCFDDSPGDILILCGDTPLIKGSSLQEMLAEHRQDSRDLTLLTTMLDNPENYGRIICDERGHVRQIVEQKDANPEQLKIQEINGGIYCVDKQFLFSALEKVGTDNNQGEVYLTDIVSIGVDSGMRVGRYVARDPVEVLGVNSRLELAQAQIELQRRRNSALMAAGVTIYSPDTVRISGETIVENDTIIEPGVVISGKSLIGCGCTIRQGAILENCRIEGGVEIGPYSHLSNQTINENTTVPSHTVG
jgi:bifunctional UDP-N-acetylglucosamine pyrophosphorylase/glucosamine-1-phosphate N-acetyltransferase